MQAISEILNFNLISSDANCLKDCIATQGKAVPAPSEAAPVFSIITSVHVLHENLAAALDSVRYQTYPNFEHIIVVDSNDSDLLEFLAMYSNEDPRVTVIPKGLNLGTYHSRNLALTYASGKYAMAHDSDDLLTLDALHRYLAGFQENDVVAIGGMALRITDSNETVSPDHEGYVLRMGYPTFCFEVGLTHEIGFFDAVRHSADSEFISRVTKFFPK